MGDISREPLPSGPRSNSGSGKGPSELIRYEDLSAEPSGASASEADLRGRDARESAALDGDLRGVDARDVDERGVDARDVAAREVDAREVAARDESGMEPPAPELALGSRMSAEPREDQASPDESKPPAEASPPRFEPGFESAFEPLVPLAADPFGLADDALLLDASALEPAREEAAEAVAPEAAAVEPVPELAAAPAEGEPSSAELAADLEVSEAELALDVTMGPPAADPALAPPSSAAEELADEAPDLHEPGEIARVALAVLVSTREPMSVLRLAELVQAAPSEVEAGLERLAAELRAQGFPLELLQIDGAYRIATSPAVYPYLVRLKKLKKAERLTPAALETLAVIAYRQPVIRAEIEAIRGVKAGPVLKSLLDHKLVRVVGRADVPGHPLQYGTSQLFLDRFGLRSLEDLPSVQELKSLGG